MPRGAEMLQSSFKVIVNYTDTPIDEHLLYRFGLMVVLFFFFILSSSFFFLLLQLESTYMKEYPLLIEAAQNVRAYTYT
jgi:hypothetical protein